LFNKQFAKQNYYLIVSGNCELHMLSQKVFIETFVIPMSVFTNFW